jgi:hypothetical protein
VAVGFDGYYGSKLLVCKQLHGNGLPLTTTSAIIDLRIIAILRKELQHGVCANSHGLRVVTRPPFFRALDLCRQQSADRRINTRHKRGLVAPHSAETETSRRLQLPYLLVQARIYVMFFSTSTRVMEINYFRNTFNYWF